MDTLRTSLLLIVLACTGSGAATLAAAASDSSRLGHTHHARHAGSRHPIQRGGAEGHAVRVSLRRRPRHSHGSSPSYSTRPSPTQPSSPPSSRLSPQPRSPSGQTLQPVSSGPSPQPEPSSGPLPAALASSDNPFAGQHFYVDPGSQAVTTQREWSSQGRTAEAAAIGKIASQPTAQWFGNWSYGHGGTAGDVSWWVGSATAAEALPVLVAYDIPWRDCSQYSSGGAPSAEAYRQYIDAMLQGIAGRRAAVIVEPDALPELGCLSSERQATYYTLLNYAVARLGSNPQVSVYLDAGNAGWQPAPTMVARLRAAGVAHARGFSLNVSNFDTTASETAYGTAIANALGGGAHFMIDTSRNGRGPAPGGAWCNPPGRGLGAAPTSQTGNALIDAYFWIKRPGQSDGTCNGGPAAGQWWPQYALGLAQNASW